MKASRSIQWCAVMILAICCAAMLSPAHQNDPRPVGSPASAAIAAASSPACPWVAEQTRLETKPASEPALQPAAAPVQAAPRLRSGKFKLDDADRKYWAFQPVARPPVPVTADSPAAANPIDAFILAGLQQRGLTMSPPATPREQLRRASFDLLGLPPTPEDVAAFERDPSDAAWERWIDRMLASPHYGERWGRHWLDLVRYAESNGYERDGAKPDAWRYRDYVIGAFNDDKPYDQFIREQLAGDEIAEAMNARTATPEWLQAMIATGFHRLHVWDDEPDDTVVAEYDDLDDVMVTTGAAFLGLTIGCARCHDHKFDPISQADYYSLLAFFRGVDPYGRHKTGGGGRGTGKIHRPLATPAQINRWESGKQSRISLLEVQLKQPTDPAKKKQLENSIKMIREESPPYPFALAVAENGPDAPPTHILARGDAHSPRTKVEPAFPAVLGLAAPTIAPRPPGAATSGRRTALAGWVADPGNPLTARVIVNRLWQRHFGVGIVPTPDDFGRTGLPPTNLPLLDHLAWEFTSGGWRIKRMHRLIMTSRAYRMSSRADLPQALSVDQSNRLFWRQNPRRIEAEAIRDTMLAAGGSLNSQQGGPGVYPALPAEIHATQDTSGKGWADSPPHQQRRRSVYLVVKRALKVPLLETLDFANSSSPVGVRPVTTTAPQALMMLNDVFVHEQAAALAERLRRQAGDSMNTRIELAFAIVLQRSPTAAEQQAASSLIADQSRLAIEESRHAPDHLALVSFCRAMLNINEMIHVD